MSRALIARATDRGLGILTKHIYDGLEWDRTIVVTNPTEPFEDHLEWYPDGTVVDISVDGWQSSFLELVDWAGVDTVFSCETLYDWQLAECFRPEIRSVVMGMSELVPHAHPSHPHPPPPDQWVWPTDWLGYLLPVGPVLPVPSFDRHPSPGRSPDDPLLVSHIAGRIAKGDRNGTELFLQALSRYRGPRINAVICVQEGHVEVPRLNGANVELMVVRAVGNRWDMHLADLMVMPRRYGGLCLPVIESLSAGVPVMMTGCHPNASYWPIVPINCRRGPQVHVPTGRIVTHIANPSDIAAKIRMFAEAPNALANQRRVSLEWAQANTWDAHRARWDAVIGR